ncbi:MAG TPA: hypothetical protein DCO83_07260, partial [Mucilaginibacter sp.]|nr:hypothetical protein [Mucilaginibacter sp.]
MYYFIAYRCAFSVQTFDFLTETSHLVSVLLFILKKTGNKFSFSVIEEVKPHNNTINKKIIEKLNLP